MTKRENEILSKIKFSYKLANRPKKFIPRPWKLFYDVYDCTIEYNGKSYNYEYQVNDLDDKPTIEEVFDELLSDMFYYLDCEKNYDKFVSGLQNDNTDCDCELIDPYYYACKETTEALHNMFTDDEIRMIDEDLFYRT